MTIPTSRLDEISKNIQNDHPSPSEHREMAAEILYWRKLETDSEPAATAPPQQRKLVVPIKVWCPSCGAQHIDETRNGERWDRRAHTTHRCQGCGADFDVYVSGAP